MKLKVYVTLVKSMPGWHRVFSASSLDAPGLCRGTCCDRDTSGPFASVIVWRNRGEVSTSPISHQSQSLGKIKTFAHVWQSLVIWCALNSMVTWWSERHGMTLHYSDKTLRLFVKNCLWMLWRAVSDCPLGFMTGTNCNSHDVIYLKRRTFFRNSPQYCTGTKKTNIEWAFSLLTQPVVA